MDNLSRPFKVSCFLCTLWSIISKIKKKQRTISRKSQFEQSDCKLCGGLLLLVDWSIYSVLISRMTKRIYSSMYVKILPPMPLNGTAPHSSALYCLVLHCTELHWMQWPDCHTFSVFEKLEFGWYVVSMCLLCVF